MFAKTKIEDTYVYETKIKPWVSCYATLTKKPKIFSSTIKRQYSSTSKQTEFLF